MISQADLGMLDGLERALINGRLRMAYQPKISLSDGRLRRVEALVRWDDPELGAISPARFVPLAEKHGLIDELTQWGLRTTLRQWLSWREQGLDTCLAFNISALSLDQLDFPDLVLKLLAAGEKVSGYNFDGYWMDLGRPDDYAQASDDFECMRSQFLPEE